jgi:LDH2 family malate/lactate/ureidoglycolate dehydrogenase
MAIEIRVPHEQLVPVIGKALAREGVPAELAETEAEIIVEADLFGVPSHGVRMLPGLVKAIREGRVTANPNIHVVGKHGATCVLDGENGPGRFISVQAMKNAVHRARQFGIGACLATRVSHWGRAHAYVSRAAKAGTIGICTTNAIPNMVAWGSSKPLLGNNPLAIGVPRGSGEEPLVLDMAMSQAALGKLGTFAREGRKAPDGWGLDTAGNASDDPAAILASGRVLPFGEHKGAGLAVMMELLTGALSGGLFSFEVFKADTSGIDPGASKLFIALDVRAFVDSERFHQRVKDFVEYVRHAEPGLQVALPGERGWQTRERNLAEGIPIHPEIVSELRSVGVELTGV